MTSRLRKFKRGEDVQLTEHFHLREFECKCGKCPFTLVDMYHVERLEELRKILGVPIYINSGYRCAKHNARVGGSPKSQHLYGRATDIRAKGMKALEVWLFATMELVFDGVGKYENFTHLDSRGFIARWQL